MYYPMYSKNTYTVFHLEDGFVGVIAGPSAQANTARLGATCGTARVLLSTWLWADAYDAVAAARTA